MLPILMLKLIFVARLPNEIVPVVVHVAAEAGCVCRFLDVKPCRVETFVETILLATLLDLVARVLLQM